MEDEGFRSRYDRKQEMEVGKNWWVAFQVGFQPRSKGK